MKSSQHISVDTIDWENLILKLTDWGIKHFEISRDLIILGTGERVDDVAVAAVIELFDKLGKIYNPKSQNECYRLTKTIMKHKFIDLFRKSSYKTTNPTEDMPESKKAEVENIPVDMNTLEDAEKLETTEHYYQFTNGEMELKEIIDAAVDFGELEPRNIANLLGISVEEFHRRQKRLNYNRNHKKSN
ncbi:hypothetical protein BH24ACI1_BH24ACI1_24660 [soil metagenome]